MFVCLKRKRNHTKDRSKKTKKLTKGDSVTDSLLTDTVSQQTQTRKHFGNIFFKSPLAQIFRFTTSNEVFSLIPKGRIHWMQQSFDFPPFWFPALIPFNFPDGLYFSKNASCFWLIAPRRCLKNSTKQWLIFSISRKWHTVESLPPLLRTSSQLPSMLMLPALVLDLVQQHSEQQCKHRARFWTAPAVDRSICSIFLVAEMNRQKIPNPTRTENNDYWNKLLHTKLTKTAIPCDFRASVP